MPSSHQKILLPGENSIEVDIVTDRDSERERAKPKNVEKMIDY